MQERTAAPERHLLAPELLCFRRISVGEQPFLWA